MSIIVHRHITWISSPITSSCLSLYLASNHDITIIVHCIIIWLSSSILSLYYYHHPSLHHNMTIIVHRIMTWLSSSITSWHDMTIIVHRIMTWLSSSIASWDSSYRHHHPAIRSSIAAMSIHLMGQMDYILCTYNITSIYRSSCQYIHHHRRIIDQWIMIEIWSINEAW